MQKTIAGRLSLGLGFAFALYSTGCSCGSDPAGAGTQDASVSVFVDANLNDSAIPDGGAPIDGAIPQMSVIELFLLPLLEKWTRHFVYLASISPLAWK